MPKPVSFLTTHREIQSLAQHLANEPALAVDTEFIRETTFFPKIALIQVANREEAWLLDPTCLGKEELEPFNAILRDPKILKVMHAAYADQECFHWSYGFVAQNVLDTSIAAALCGMGDSIGLAKLLRDVLDIHIPKGRSRVKWLQRPLSPELLRYAEQDVLHLVELSDRLIEKLKGRGRVEWALEESQIEASAFDLSPEVLADRLGKNAQFDSHGLPTLRELVRWREERARAANLPRHWVADNEVLVALAKVRPKHLDELRSFRGLHSKEIDRSGQRILQALRQGEEATPIAPTPRELTAPRGEDEGHLVNFLQTYIAYLARNHAIAPRYLATAGQALWIAQHPEAQLSDWIDRKILSKRAADLIGSDLAALLRGERALVLKEGRLTVVEHTKAPRP